MSEPKVASPIMMRRRAMTAGITATAGVSAALAANMPIAALVVIAGYVLVGGGRAGWRRPRWYEPVVSGALACVTATLTPNPWWAIAFLAIAVIEALRVGLLICHPDGS